MAGDGAVLIVGGRARLKSNELLAGYGVRAVARRLKRSGRDAQRF
jgi:hypothetical protein